jgi:hypothetical protein
VFGGQHFKQCVIDGLQGKGYGKKRIAEITTMFDRHERIALDDGKGPVEAAFQAARNTLDDITFEKNDKAKAAMKAWTVFMDTTDRAVQGIDLKGGVFGQKGAGFGLARGIIAMLQMDPRFKGLNFFQTQRSYAKRYWAIMSDVLDHFGKGAFGRQLGKAHGLNVVREIFGRDTGDAAAKQIAEAYKKVGRIMVDDFNQAGGGLRFLEDFHLPQRQSTTRLLKADPKQYVDMHVNELLDWNKMRWPDGTKIAPDERADLVNYAFKLKSTDGRVDIQPQSMRGRGKAVGDMIDKHRLFIYKDAEAWMKQHELWGEGEIFDVMAAHIEHMAHKTALVQMFGRSPEVWKQQAKAIVEHQAGIAAATASSIGGRKADLKAVAQADALMGRNKTFENMFDTITHTNHMDPHNGWAAGIVGASNLLVSAQLGSIAFLAMTGDLLTTVASRFVNHMPLHSGLDTYLTGMVTPGAYGNMQRMLTRAGHVWDEAFSSNYAASRWTGVSTYGPAITRRLADTTMRASLVTRHTNMLRGVAVMEHMGMLDEYRSESFDNLPFKYVMERYGITARDWDVVRKLPAWSPNGKATFMRPLDIMGSNLIDRDQLYRKFFTLVDAESFNMVPGSTVEAQVFLRGSNRPDTLPGAVLHSFGMYKNFPVTAMLQYGRLATAGGASVSRRVAFAAGLGVGSVAVGALGIQLRELSRGRTPLPMNTMAFWGKSALAGGALSIWGDFLFQGRNEFGRGVADIAAGPIAGLATDIANLTIGESFAWLEAADAASNYHAKFGAKLTEFMRRNTPGTSIWYARLVLEREIWDSMQRWTDPKAHSKWNAKVRKQKREFGNDYWSRPGEPLFGGR